MKIKNMIIYNTTQNSGTVMNFPDQNKNGEQLKHRNIINEILWIYGSTFHIIFIQFSWVREKVKFNNIVHYSAHTNATKLENWPVKNLWTCDDRGMCVYPPMST